ncbi:EAL domain-containing protein [Synechococcus sp. RSCCF101]|uniref:putative bifunctional diguanylate cyclase/phosphodiesterase n=1 Tax=Synechococcus sp. RSCCF101 TaxID=2511069 RepID=UPI00124683F0|nr:EAL domain-containing protein [Synechococcus sp. RSCCF101]QEY32046.1 EAL domain-containing protein [Synechococcus sp. RSCCF101]
MAISTVRNAEGQSTGFVGVFSDISASKGTEARLQWLGQHDSLTGLPNRLLFDALLGKRLLAAQRDGTRLAVIHIDLDSFKPINNSFGHLAGDELLQHLGTRLKKLVRSSDTVARIGGDEFLLLLDDLVAPSEARGIAGKIHRELQAPFQIGPQRFYTTCSLGLSVYPEDGADGLSLIRHADTALQRAKDQGRNTICCFTEDMSAGAQREAQLLNGLGHGLSCGEFSLAYQPQVEIRTGRLLGMEVLLRWDHGDLGPITPDQFIPVAERSGFIRELGDYVLQEACFQARTWHDMGLAFGYVAVNVAGSQIQQLDFASAVEDALERSGLPADCLELELTESCVMNSIETSIGQLQELQRMGVRTSVDDFGTGYSSLAYLRHLPVSRLKIDKSFIRGLPADGNDAAIADAVIALSRALNLEVIAEGVETRQQAEFLGSRGCGIAQGYFYGRPMTAEAMQAALVVQGGFQAPAITSPSPGADPPATPPRPRPPAAS